MIGPGVIIALVGLLVIWVAIRMWQGRLPRNSIAGVRTRATMRSSEAFYTANKAAAPLAVTAGVFLTAGGLAAAILADSEGATALLAGALTCAALAIAGGIIGVRACR